MVCGVTARVRDFTKSKMPGEAFTLRECLKCGNRNAVDQALHRMVRSGELIRLSRGVYTRRAENMMLPTIDEIIHLKAECFRRIIRIDGNHALESVLFGARPEQMWSFATDAASSAFSVFNERIKIRRYAMRKLHFGNTKLGLLIRGLWDRGPTACTSELRDQIFKKLSASEIGIVAQSPHWMPDWMSDWLLYDVPPRIRKRRKDALADC